MWKKILIGAIAFFVLVGIIGSLGGGSDDEASERETTASTTSAARTEPAATTVEPEPVDTGRMSESEFAEFSRAHAELVDESSQFADVVQRCSVIGQTGDLAGFSECMEEAYAGFDEDASYARYIANETLADVDKQCLAALRSYRTVVADYTAVVTTAYKIGRQLNLELFGPAFEALPPAAQRYAKFSGNALAACEPR